ncbi:hypothetical protein V9L05_19890 [Bernardetia sp. Wsw4-3y2]|uniref:hypothetical protein n=1 Tax=Bernardetia sp. Wsw4-3y2 TaxID=3127471 RepID=UPI0030D23AC5
MINSEEFLIVKLLIASSEGYNRTTVNIYSEKVLEYARQKGIYVQDWTKEFFKIRDKGLTKSDVKNYHLFLAGSLLHYLAGSPIEENGNVFTNIYAFLRFLNNMGNNIGKEVESE